jgi:hypothetical protein
MDDEDEEERPRSRRRRDEDEEDDERPRGRRSRDEEEEDRPRSRKGRAVEDEDEEEDDDRPRRRGRAPKKNKKGLVLILAALAALLLLGVGGAALMYFVDPFGLFGGGASSDMLAWMPADTQQIEGMDVASVSKNSKALAAVRGDLKDAEAIGIKAEDISSVIQGKKGGKGAAAEVMVLKLKSSADKDKISKAAGGTGAEASGKKYYKTKTGGGLYFPSDKLVVLTKSENTLTGLLQKEDGKVVISDELKSTVKRADGDMWMAAAGSAANMFDAGGAGGGPKGGMPGFGPTPAPKNSLATAKLSGDDVNMRMEITFADADTAKKAADQIDAMFKLMKGMMEGMDKMFAKAGGGGNPAAAKMQGAKKAFDTMKVTTSGSVVTITLTLPVDSMDGFGKGGFGM